MSFPNRIVGHRDADPRTLIPHRLNIWDHPPAQWGAVRESLDLLGFIDQILINQRTGHILNGHLRVELAIEAGEALVPVVEIDVDEVEEPLILATFDRLGQLAPFDHEKVVELLADASFQLDDSQLTLQNTLAAWQAEAQQALLVQEGLSADLGVVRIQIGSYRQELEMTRYTPWMDGLVEDTGGGEDAICAEILRRLGFDA